MSRASISTATAAVFLASLTGAAHAQTPNFLTQEGPEMWSASKLRGVAVFGPGAKKVGTISEVLMDHGGTATAVVIGVGGFLGIGEKDVAMPFDQVHFTDQPMPQQLRPTVAPAGTDATANNSAAIPTTTALGMPAETTGNPNAAMATGGAPGGNSATGGSAAVPPTLGSPVASTTGNSVPGANGMAAVPAEPSGRVERSTAYPDHGTVDLTADQLKAAPAFKFAR